MIGDEFRNYQRFVQIADLMHTEGEAAAKADTTRFDSFLTAEPDLEERLKEIIRADAMAGDGERSEYVSFHTRRFDQVRAVAALRKKVMTNIPRLRVLEVGASPVTSMYARVVDDIDLYTADLPAAEPPEEIARRFGSKEHYYINLDTDALTDRYPRLIEQSFHIVLFCEVIEHARASPEEMIADLLEAGGARRRVDRNHAERHERTAPVRCRAWAERRFDLSAKCTRITSAPSHSCPGVYAQGNSRRMHGMRREGSAAGRQELFRPNQKPGGDEVRQRGEVQIALVASKAAGTAIADRRQKRAGRTTRVEHDPRTVIYRQSAEA